MNLFQEEIEQTAIERIRKFARIADTMGFDIAIGFSGGKGTKSERVQSVQNHILSLQGDAESNEELSMLADLLQRTITYGNFIGQQPLDAE